MLKTKCMNDPVEADDGIRICVMQNPSVYYRQLKDYRRKYGRPMYDIHMPELGPPKWLKDGYKNGKITWKEYEPIFRREVLKKNWWMIMLIAGLAVDQNVTLLCSERKADYCHRRLDAEEIRKYQPNLEVIIDYKEAA